MFIMCTVSIMDEIPQILKLLKIYFEKFGCFTHHTCVEYHEHVENNFQIKTVQQARDLYLGTGNS